MQKKKAVRVSISESKPDRAIVDPEIHIKNHKILHCYMNRQRCVACNIKGNIS